MSHKIMHLKEVATNLQDMDILKYLMQHQGKVEKNSFF